MYPRRFCILLSSLMLPLLALPSCGAQDRSYGEWPLAVAPLTADSSLGAQVTTSTASGVNPMATDAHASGTAAATTPPSNPDSSSQSIPSAYLPVCGNAQFDVGEECDDGALNSDVGSNACRSNCKQAHCGDGVPDNYEECDDGNTTNEDTCTNLCKSAYCGDAIQQAAEQCDDGNAVDNDGCTNGCTIPGCGDHVVQAGEACDDGNTVNDDACSNDCAVPGCGDGITQLPLEECDDGFATAACTAACKRPACGDGFLQGSEECDDGNLVNTDACTTLCTRAKCGDGILSTGESCEDGNRNNGDGCSASCQSEVCGDGQATGIEQCDDGNRIDNDGCSATCSNETCGDGVVQPPREECEDLNTVDTDVCRNGCKNAKSLNALSNSCGNVDQITQTVCMVAVANWCKQYNVNPVAGMVTGQLADNLYSVGCVSGFSQRDVSTSVLDDCQPGQQQSPACLEQVNDACQSLGFGRGFYLGTGASSNTFALACDAGTTSTKSISGCNGISNSSPVPVGCAKALATECGSNRGGMLQARAQSSQVTFTCIDLSLTGTARQF